jgi:hypothetical protein
MPTFPQPYAGPATRTPANMAVVPSAATTRALPGNFEELNTLGACPRLKVQAKVKARAVNPIKTTTSKTQSRMAVSMSISIVGLPFFDKSRTGSTNTPRSGRPH